MSTISRFCFVFVVAALTMVVASTTLAAPGPNWMPGFPMRMGPTVMLMWAPMPGATAYNVYKSEKDGDLGEKIASIPANNHMDNSAPLDKNAFYTVKAVINGAESDPSPVGKLFGAKPMDPPTFTGVMQTDQGIAVRWGIIKEAVFYNVYKSETKEGPFTLVGSFQDSKLVDAEVEEGKTYYYQVSAFNKTNVESPKSEVYEYTVPKAAAQRKARVRNTLATIPVEFNGYIYGADEDPLKAPRALIDLNDGNYFVIEGNDIMMIDGNGTKLGTVVPPEDYDQAWGQPMVLSYTPGADYFLAGFGGFGGVRILGLDGSLIAEWKLIKPTKEEYQELGREEDWEFDKSFKSSPGGICEDSQGNIWVMDGVFGQIHLYDSAGEFIQKFGVPRSREKIDDALGVIGSAIYSPENNRVYFIDMSNRFLRMFDAETFDFVKDAEGNYNYGANVGGNGVGMVQKMASFGIGEGNIYIIDRMSGGVQVYDMELKYAGTLVIEGQEDKKFFDEFSGTVDIIRNGSTLIMAQYLQGRMARFTLK